jgi:predicted MPP superfamily phosphohydrolase
MGFLLAVLLIWGSMHAYVWCRVAAYARLPRGIAGPAALAMLVLMVMPIVGMALGRSGTAPIGRILELVGMVWAGAFFLFFSVSILHDLWNGLAFVVSLLIPQVRPLLLLGRRPLLAEAALAGVLCIYGFIDANIIRREHVSFEVPNLAQPRVRIAYVVDIHLGHIVGAGRLRRIIRVVEAVRPDVLISGGDLVDIDMSGHSDLARMLDRVEAPLGKFAVTGNHEYYAGLDGALAFTRAAGFRTLSGEQARVCEGLSLVGVDDEASHRPPFRWREPADEAALLARASEEDFAILVKHRPLVNEASIPLMDLQLSGHTHRGQIFPFTLAVVAAYDYAHGLVELAQGTALYTSRGSGTWGPPMRVFNPPEITIIDLVRGD